MSQARTRVANSHNGAITYWLDRSDRYIYQRREQDGAWIGWICAESVWDSAFSRADWIQLEEAKA